MAPHRQHAGKTGPHAGDRDAPRARERALGAYARDAPLSAYARGAGRRATLAASLGPRNGVSAA